jgi:hypothetical protein
VSTQTSCTEYTSEGDDADGADKIGFGGDDWKTLYFVSRPAPGTVNVKNPGVSVPAQKRS